MTDFNYLKPERLYNELYYQYPKVFIESDTYKNLSEGAKIAYMLLKAESEVAIYRKQIDENGNLYFELTGTQLAKMMNCSERRVTTIKKELEKFNLLKQVHMGFNAKTGKNEKNRLYLAELEVTNKDIYLMQKRAENGTENAEILDNSGLANSATSKEDAETLDNSGLAEFATPVETDETLGTSGLANSAQVFNKYNSKSLDTNRHYKDTENDLAQERLLLDSFAEIMKDESIATFIPERVLNLIATFSTSYTEAKQTVKTIHNAKYKAEKETGVKIVFEELEHYGIPAEQKLYTTLLKAYQKRKTEKVENIQNVIFVYSKNWFVETPAQAIVQSQQATNLPKVSLADWTQTYEK